MTGFDEFIKWFGDVTVLNVVEFVVIIIFVVSVYKKMTSLIVAKHEEDKKRNEKLDEALSATRKYPEYRQKSVEAQNFLQGEIDELKQMQKGICEQLQNLEETINKRERNKLRGRLLEYYRYYTSADRNPMQKWTEMESDAFWELFYDYENAGGNGYMHSNVRPAMNELRIISMDDKEGIKQLMDSRK